MSQEAVTQKLRNLFDHHAAHTLENGAAAPFVDIYVNGENEFQFGYGALNLAATDTTDEVTEYLESRDDLTYEELPQVWTLPKDWTGEQAYELCVETLERLGHDVEDVTNAVEQECPTDGEKTWDDVER